MRGLQPMHGVGRSQFARLHHQGEEAGSQAQEKKRVAQPLCGARRHRMDGNSEVIIYEVPVSLPELSGHVMEILETARLVLREFTPQDADALALVLSDAETMRYYPAPYDRVGVEQWIERNRSRYRDDGVGLWAIELKSARELIGDCGIILQEVDGERLYEIGYHLRRDFWRQGLATEAAIACRDWAFANPETERLISLIRPQNLPSRRVAERAGMTLWKEVTWRGLAHCVYSIERAQSSAQ
jgi:RimJ/RimL family protein N-acetyltransferase